MLAIAASTVLAIAAASTVDVVVVVVINVNVLEGPIKKGASIGGSASTRAASFVDSRFGVVIQSFVVRRDRKNDFR